VILDNYSMQIYDIYEEVKLHNFNQKIKKIFKKMTS